MKRDFPFPSEKLSEKINEYFDTQRKQGLPPTDAGLCRAVGLPYARYKKLLAYAAEYSEHPLGSQEALGVAQKYEKQNVQWEHVLELQRGVLRVMEVLQGDKAPNAIFATKQPHLGAWTEKPETDRSNGEVKVVIKLDNLNNSGA